VALGEIGAPIGLSGAVRLHTLKSVTGLPIDDSLLMQSPDCWIYIAQSKPARWLYSAIQECSVQTRDQAEQLRGAQVGLSRSVFPEPSEDEAYWADLLGCTVVNRQGSLLGEVQSLQTNGAHDWLVLDAGMIPFVAQYIDQVDTPARRIDVDWDPEWWQ
jgi:16S rRNA processing protein RimM